MNFVQEQLIRSPLDFQLSNNCRLRCNSKIASDCQGSPSCRTQLKYVSEGNISSEMRINEVLSDH